MYYNFEQIIKQQKQQITSMQFRYCLEQRKINLEQQNQISNESSLHPLPSFQNIIKENRDKKLKQNSRPKEKDKKTPLSLNINQFLHQYQLNSGIVRGEWYTQQGHLQTICYGTGVAISERIVITCAHTIFLEAKQKPCDAITFIPQHSNGRLQPDQKIYRSSTHNFLHFQPLKKGQTYSKCPLSEDIALIYLSTDIEMQSFPQVGVECQEELKIGGDLAISGFPSRSYYNKSNLRDINFERVNLIGRLLQLQANTIFHNLQTSTGHSGSGIFGVNTSGVSVLAGIHTHKGQHRNSGVYLSHQILKRLISYEIKFALQHKSCKMNIKFPDRLKQEVILQYPGNQLQKDIIHKRLRLNQKEQIKAMQIEDKKVQSDEEIKAKQPPTITRCQDQQWQNQILQYDIQQDESNYFKRMVEMYSQNQRWLSEIKDSALQKLLYQFIEISHRFFKLVKKGVVDLPKAKFTNELKIQFDVFYQSIGDKIKTLQKVVSNSIGTKISISKFKSVDQHLQEVDRDPPQIILPELRICLNSTPQSRSTNLYLSQACLTKSLSHNQKQLLVNSSMRYQ